MNIEEKKKEFTLSELGAMAGVAEGKERDILFIQKKDVEQLIKEAKLEQCNKIFDEAKENDRFGQMQLFALSDILSNNNQDYSEQRLKELESK